MFALIIGLLILTTCLKTIRKRPRLLLALQAIIFHVVYNQIFGERWDEMKFMMHVSFSMLLCYIQSIFKHFSQYIDNYHEDVFNNNTQFVSYYNEMKLVRCMREGQSQAFSQTPLWYELKYNNEFWQAMDPKKPVRK